MHRRKYCGHSSPSTTRRDIEPSILLNKVPLFSHGFSLWGFKLKGSYSMAKQIFVLKCLGSTYNAKLLWALGAGSGVNYFLIGYSKLLTLRSENDLQDANYYNFL